MKGEDPGALDVADDGQSTTARVAEHFLRQSGNEGIRSDGHTALECLL